MYKVGLVVEKPGVRCVYKVGLEVEKAWSEVCV